MSNKAKRGDTPEQVQIMITNEGIVVLRLRAKEAGVLSQTDTFMQPHQAAAMGKMLLKTAQIAMSKKPIIVPGAGGKFPS